MNLPAETVFTTRYLSRAPQLVRWLHSRTQEFSWKSLYHLALTAVFQLFYLLTPCSALLVIRSLTRLCTPSLRAGAPLLACAAGRL
jgi:hypothetical protein